MIVVRPLDPSDIDRVHALRAQSFPGVSPERDAPEMTAASYRVAERDGAVIACLRIHRFAHYWGGNAVRAAGIASVAVAAEARGKGVGAALMRETLTELRADGTLISSLYPATVPVYRACGYGFGGIRTAWKAELDHLPQTSPIAIEPFTDADLDEVDACYRRLAARANGLVQRSPEWWDKRVLSSSSGSPTFRYLVREEGRVTGWLVYRIEQSKDTWRFTMQCRDLFWETANAARALLSLGSLHRSTGARLAWVGPPTEPLADLVAEDVVQLDDAFRWMVRLVDVPGAIEARGYPPSVTAQVSIAVRDPVLPENEGPWRITVEGGSAKVEPARTADATADAPTWASIWSGLHLARDAVRLGMLDATPPAVAALESMFAGPLPWIADFY